MLISNNYTRKVNKTVNREGRLPNAVYTLCGHK